MDGIAARSEAHHVDARERIPARDIARHALGEIRACRLEGPRPRRREQLTPHTEHRDQTDRGHDGGDPAETDAGCRRPKEQRRRHETERARQPVERLIAQGPDGKVSEQTARRGTRQVERVDRAARRRSIAQRADDDPAREQHGRHAEHVCRRTRRKHPHDERVELSLDQECREHGESGRDREPACADPLPLAIERRRGGRADRDAHERAAHHQEREVITERRAEEPSLCELEEEARGGNEKDSAQLGPSWHLGTLPMAALSRLSVREQYPGVSARPHQIRRALSSPTP